jgi:hypothetical protein
LRLALRMLPRSGACCCSRTFTTLVRPPLRTPDASIDRIVALSYFCVRAAAPAKTAVIALPSGLRRLHLVPHVTYRSQAYRNSVDSLVRLNSVGGPTAGILLRQESDPFADARTGGFCTQTGALRKLYTRAAFLYITLCLQPLSQGSCLTLLQVLTRRTARASCTLRSLGQACPFMRAGLGE